MIKFSKTVPDGRHVTEARDCTVRALAHVAAEAMTATGMMVKTSRPRPKFA